MKDLGLSCSKPQSNQRQNPKKVFLILTRLEPDQTEENCFRVLSYVFSRSVMKGFLHKYWSFEKLRPRDFKKYILCRGANHSNLLGRAKLSHGRAQLFSHRCQLWPGFGSGLILVAQIKKFFSYQKNRVFRNEKKKTLLGGTCDLGGIMFYLTPFAK